MRPILAGMTSIGLAIAATSPAEALDGAGGRFDVPAGPLPRAIVTLARQAGVTIATSEAGAAQVHVRAVRAAPTIDAALRAMLQGSGFEAIRIDAATYVVRRSRHAARRSEPRAAPPVPHTPKHPAADAEIVVTASKLPQPLAAFSGTVQVLDLDQAGMRNTEGRGTGAIVDQLPVMASTGLGPGRDKLFVRGIADSSFTGTTQAAVGQYLGEVRLNYNTPDPSLALYDLSRIELLEGPQATLYGAGALGGILRLVPNRPVHGRSEGSVLSSVAAAANGRIGSDLAGVLNVPLGTDVATRVVAYGGTTPGMVDDIQRGLHAVGRSRILGGRAVVEARLAGDWSIEAGGAFQRIDHRDARYAEGPDNPPARSSSIAQPASNMFGLGEITVRKRWADGVELVSASALVKNDLAARYDLSPVASGVLNDSRSEAVLVSNETRLSRSTSRTAGWLIGIHGVSSASQFTTALEREGKRINQVRIGTGVADVALFGEAAADIGPTWTATLGGRVAYSEVRVLGSLPPEIAVSDLDPLKRAVLRILPSAAIAWHRADLSAYTRYQRGYRVGGLTVIPIIDPFSGERSFSVDSFRPDTVDMVEAGLRFGNVQKSAVSGALAVSVTRWRNIQADVIDTYGPYTTNVGDVHVLGLEGSASWRPDDRLTLSAAFSLVRSTRLKGGTDDPSGSRLSLPNIPLATLRVDAERSFRLHDEFELVAHARGRYVGRSDIGVGGSSLLRQGDYFDVGAGIEVRRGGGTVFLEAENLLNVRGNRFGLGNPYIASSGDQRIPLKPRTFRLGARKAFR